MAIRKIIQIEEDKCNGCGVCVPNCAEGAIKIIDGKAKLVKDSYCDGLGACLGHCPQDALHIIEREAPEFDEEEAIKSANSTTSISNRIIAANSKPAPLQHSGGCPGSRIMTFGNDEDKINIGSTISNSDLEIKIRPQLRQWPVQLSLVPINAPFFDNADLLVTADCVPFAYANYHIDILKGKVVVMGCPKLDDIEAYTDKLFQIINRNNIKSVTVAYMEVPCCSGIVKAVALAIQKTGKNIPVKKLCISISGNII